MISLWKYQKIPLLCIGISCILYGVFAYHITRTDTSKLVLIYAVLFVLAFQLIKHSGFNFRLLVGATLIFRVVLLLAIPNLSQDFYRFIWDGRLIIEGFNPYLYTPDALMQNGELPIPKAKTLYDGMGALSAAHFTNYPPINQLCFVIANLFPGKNILSAIIGLKCIIIAADIGTLYFGKKLLEHLKLPSTQIFWYILNPFIIIELTGNLHFEGVMIFFLVWSLYLLHCGKWKWAAVLWACSISVKLIPLLFLPLFFLWFVKKEDTATGLKKLIYFYAIIGVSTLLLFLPFLSLEFITNYSKTVGLWFGNFEFNASLYYIVRAIGYYYTGFNEIAIISKILPICAVLIILGFSFFKQNNSISKLATSMLLAFTCYLFLSTTVHPWYITTLVILCVFTTYRFPLVWSVVIVLSYFAYANTTYTENLWIIALEYGLVSFAFIWEVVFNKKIKL